MVVIVLLLPVMLLLMLFGLDVFENLLFPPSSASAPEKSQQGDDLPDHEE
ncbi:hypothetical protein [Streptomyces sp. HYC2]|nr:hypothetical protein [Streptomyces sp. HYC2]